MKNLNPIRLLGIVLAGAFLFGSEAPSGTPAAGSGTEDDPWVLPKAETVRLACDPYPDVAIGWVVVQISPQSASGASSTDLVEIRREVHVKPGAALSAPLWPEIEQMADGRYKLRAKVISEALVESDWTDWFWFVKDWRKPEPPGGCALLK